MSPFISSFIIYIAIFLFGMTVMKIGLQSLAEERLKKVIELATNHPYKGFLIGIAATMILQSSSAVTVIAVGLTAVRLMTFPQTIGIILGANIGTTITGEIAAIHLDHLNLILLLIGVACLFLPHQKLFCLGTCLFGLGCLFTAMNGFNRLSAPLQTFTPIKAVLLMANDHHISAVIAGALFTAVIQSSSATTLVAMGFLNHHALTIASAIAVTLGANIGTCITAYLASLGSSWEARWTSYTHIAFNFLGVVLFLPFIDLLASTVAYFTDSIPLQLAHAGVIFNVVTALLALPFASKYGKWIEQRHGIKN